jgi:cellulose synthase/poly-beta-1,6-N-acetylglucosamine synthase-like glycosyltransferase
VYTFYVYLRDVLANGGFYLFLAFFVFVWTVWIAKTLIASRYRPFVDQERATERLRTSVIVPVFDEPDYLFRRVLASVDANEPAELIVVVDGGDPRPARVARELTDKVYLVPKRGKRAAIERGLAESDPTTDVVVIVDSDTVWEAGMLRRLLYPFADKRVGGVTPKQSILARNRNNVRRLADWLEDIRYGLTVPAQSVLGQVGCLAGRTIAYRRAACEPAVERLIAQRVFGIVMHVGDDRVLTNEILRSGWRTVYQATARVQTDSPNTWRAFWQQQLRWGRSSQRETFLCLGWLWRRPFTLLCFLSDIIIPFLLYAVLVTAVIRVALGVPSPIDAPILAQLGLAYCGMITSIGVRQIPHFRRYPGDALALPIFVLQVTFFMAPTRIAAFATMFHQNWHTRGPKRRRRDEDERPLTRLEREQTEVPVASAGSG